MPEGPEIRRAADRVANALVGLPTDEVWFAFPHLKPYEEQLRGEVVAAIDTYGKAILTRFENGLSIYSHNQLYGVWMVRKPYNYPKTNRQLRLAIHNSKKSALLYSASDIEVLDADGVANHPFLSAIGPDLLDPELDAETLQARLESDPFRRRQLAGLLLDQRFLAGTGNYLRSEILHRAGINPRRRPADLSADELKALSRAAIELTRRSYETGGITNDPERATRLKEEGKGYRDYRHYVFNREGRQCYRCGGKILKEAIGGRRLYFCTDCQADPKRR